MHLHVSECLTQNKFQDQGLGSGFRILSDSVFVTKNT